MLPLIALLLPILLVFLGFAVDVAYMQTTRMELQAAADSAARAGATKLSQTDNAAEARNMAIQIASQNMVAGSPLLLRSSEVEVGRSKPNSSGKWVFSANGTPANAVRISAGRTKGSRSGAVPLFFGRLIGSPTFQPVQSSTASFINVDICLVLDRSTSMKQGIDEGGNLYESDPRFCKAPNKASRWMALDSAVRLFIDELQDSEADEHVALATYSSGSDNLPKGMCGASKDPASLDCSLSADLTRIEKAMDRLKTTVWNGNTYIEAGIEEGLGGLTDSKLARASAERILIVLTDGRENVGTAANAAKDCAAAGVLVHTITFSEVANQATMKEVARIGGGKHYHADDAADLKKVFRELAAQTALLTE
jgi:Flp pilus assembly protein TadG